VRNLRGRRSNRALTAEARELALSVASDPLLADFGPTLLAEHLDRRFGLVASPDTLRRWMLGAGLVGAAPQAGEAPKPASPAGGDG
jgi:hypothetical protein